MGTRYACGALFYHCCDVLEGTFPNFTKEFVPLLSFNGFFFIVAFTIINCGFEFQ